MSGHDHTHTAPAPGTSASARYIPRLAIAAGLGAVTLVTQVTVGLSTSSLALLSDSAHVFTDVFGIVMALAAVLIALRAASRPDRTFGLHRGEVFAALLNSLLLFGVAGWVLYEAVSRLAAPPEVPGWPVTIVAVIGLAMNVAAFLALRSGAEESLNVRGAYLEVMADMLGSFGVLISGLLTVLFGWRYADPLIGVGIALFVLPRAFTLGRRAVRILLQHAPSGLDVPAAVNALTELPGVHEVHDFHAWTLTSGMEVASVHLTVDTDADTAAVLAASREVFENRFGLSHVTVQIEPERGAGRCTGENPAW
ncbi:cation transporter [Nocardia cyriacigeorgica]|uniref:Cation transporter n=2 Tax=Nocardiaceae TaxID=85025 RepID=A0A6P1CL42_9NOCA|nr:MULTISPECIES: cation diffusion facilitator family transporter [Nocardia]NEW33321.1 cation transporter [Nocardia cyriacigeorgica]BDT85556.1 cation efflux system protein [Nocardia cyriacigeorgica]